MTAAVGGFADMPALARITDIRTRFAGGAPGRGVLGAAQGAGTSSTTATSSTSAADATTTAFEAVLRQAQQAATGTAATGTGGAAATGATGWAKPSGDTSGVLTDETPYAELFRTAGATHGIDPALLAAVAKVESGFDPQARSSAGAEGLMQFMPGTSGGMGVDPWDPASAIDGAARLLRSHRDRFGSVELALAAYNAGPGNVSRYGGVPPFAETRAYVAKVMALAPGAA